MLARTMKMTVVAVGAWRRGRPPSRDSGHRRPGRLKPAGVETPQRGSTMSAVEAEIRRAGQQELAAVGNPPITKWFYPNFVVVFENDKVLHAVVVAG